MSGWRAVHNELCPTVSGSHALLLGDAHARLCRALGDGTFCPAPAASQPRRRGGRRHPRRSQDRADLCAGIRGDGNLVGRPHPGPKGLSVPRCDGNRHALQLDRAASGALSRCGNRDRGPGQGKDGPFYGRHSVRQAAPCGLGDRYPRPAGPAPLAGLPVDRALFSEQAVLCLRALHRLRAVCRALSEPRHRDKGPRAAPVPIGRSAVKAVCAAWPTAPARRSRPATCWP
jgi:hypothetical protein